MYMQPGIYLTPHRPTANIRLHREAMHRLSQSTLAPVYYVHKSEG